MSNRQVICPALEALEALGPRDLSCSRKDLRKASQRCNGLDALRG